jgi:hypothetical protein
MNPTAQSSSVGRTEWEYKDYVWTAPRDAEPSLPGTVIGLADIRRELWLECRSVILSEIKKWQDEGWESVIEIGPDCWELREVKKSVSAKWTPFQWLAFLIFLITMVGLPLLFLFQTDTWYLPVAFRVQMRRPKRLGTPTDIPVLSN